MRLKSGNVRIEQVGYDHDDAVKLITEVQQEYVVRYGNEDESPVEVAQFAPPLGLFLVGYDGYGPAACGGWRSHGSDAEVKRMYVTPRARGTGRARRILAELELTARAAGHERMILETGSKQPEAVSLYRSAGYETIAPFGFYAGRALAIHLGKPLG